MPDKDSFYYLNAYQDGITPGQQMTIQHKISFNDWQSDSHIAPLVGLAGEEIMRRKEASIAVEKDLLNCLDDIDMAEPPVKPSEKYRKEQRKTETKKKHIPTR